MWPAQKCSNRCGFRVFDVSWRFCCMLRPKLGPDKYLQEFEVTPDVKKSMRRTP